MKETAWIFITILLLAGCSSSGNTVLPDVGDNDELSVLRLPQTARWNWEISLYKVSADHASIQKLPTRVAGWHLNVTPFMEPPNCFSCLKISKPQVQEDGTINVNVKLSHPFPGQPQYTGFDVRGTLMFPATRYWKNEAGWVIANPYYMVFDYIPLYFSRAEDGGGELLNADGYTFYLWPGLDLGPEFQDPVFNYSRGERANGPDPDSTVNPYKLFTNDPDRNMFLVTDTITRTYHIDPPDGEFIFGYVVDASWAPPTTTPVTDPKNDFPFWANAEEGYVTHYEQLAPFKITKYPDNWFYYYDLALVEGLMYPLEQSSGYPEAYLICPTIVGNPLHKDFPIARDWIGTPSYTPGSFSTTLRPRPRDYEATPGTYDAILFVEHSYWPHTDDYPFQLYVPLYFDFVELEVVVVE